MRSLEVISKRPRAAAAIFSLLVSLVASIPITRTIIHPDEVGFILNANRLLGGGPSRLPYFPGYSTFLVPVLAATKDAEIIIRGVQVVNAVLAAGTAAMSVAILQRLRPGARSEWHLLAACAVSLYPAFRLFGSLALSENALIPASALLLLLTIRAWEEPTLQRLLVANAAAGTSLLIHQRAVGIAAGTAIAMVVATRSARHRVLGLITVAGTGIAALALARLILASDGRFGVGQSDKTSVGGLIAETLQPRSLLTLPLAAAGQLFYLSVATLGLATLGVLGVTRFASSWSTQTASIRAVAAWLVPSGLFTLTVSAMFMNQGTGDKAIYGRYVEAVVLPILLIGLATLATTLSDLERRVVLVVPSAAAILLIALRGTDAFEGRQQLLNVAGIVPIIELTDRIDPAAMAIVGTVAAFIVLTVRQRELGALGLIGLAFVAVSVTVQLRFADAADALDVSQTSDLADAVSALEGQLPDDSCVLLDETDLVDPWLQQNFRLKNIDLDFLPFLEGEPTPGCAESVLTSRRDFSVVRPGALLLAVDSSTRHAVWILPTDRQADFFTADRPGVSDPSVLLIGDTPAEVELSLTDRPETETETDEDGVFVEVRLTNRSDTAFVPPFGPPGAVGPVALGVEWRDPSNPEERLAEPYRLQLDRILYPGETIVLTASIPMAIEGEPISSGNWILRAELVQEAVRWVEGSSDVLSILVDADS